MSASRCIRCALEVANPAKRINIYQRPAAQLQTRSYADVSNTIRPKAAGKIDVELPSISAHNEGIESLNTPPKRSIPAIAKAASATTSFRREADVSQMEDEEQDDSPIPPNVVAAFRTPYQHPKTHGIRVGSVQLRSFSVRNLEFFADFALRVAFYLKLPASGPVPLRKRIERWTVLRSNFVHKKSQENFERITLRRLITVYDGHPEVVEIWLACLRKWQFYGVGMKANVWQHEGLDVATQMDARMKDVEKELDAKLANFGWLGVSGGVSSIEVALQRQGGNVAGSPMMQVRSNIERVKNVDLNRAKYREPKGEDSDAMGDLDKA